MRFPAYRRQTGVALITVLILLVVVTVLSLATSTTSTQDEKMASNSQEVNRTFQVAESGLERAWDEGSLTDVGGASFAYVFRRQDNADVTVIEVGSSKRPIKGYELGRYKAYHYKVRSVAVGGGGGTAAHEMGFYKVGPG